ncbi:hypothetical protein [Holdemania massiliensis]|uniref:Alternate-type signal peptide domain-containing protein n=1 Tax=Holdemania massiliensis TaxID=1468449 RepID=A0A6N7SD72_9FIRM|nr:hypothetical protein [Holdemania massiliensis]MSA73029.1 hypothetical protein [Holdemania massiliensis]MSA91226.1 hypothetical protein [Holdemania massiliensis]MSB80082.1 hypothetical protein [Holdemania massiliensis]MSC35003.1 hypothetical protein [Holdemania massiliensis]MSC41392.1 hypothetical protein [Holdemania massiliensis]
MNKKTILGLLTGAAIVAATTGSYAAWDKLTVNSVSGTVSISKPVQLTTTATTLTLNEAQRTVGSDVGPTVTAELPVTVDTANHDNLTLEAVSPTATLDGTAVNGSVTAEVYQDDQKVNDATKIMDGEYKIKVTVVLDDVDAARVNEGSLAVSVGAALSEKTEN